MIHLITALAVGIHFVTLNSRRSDLGSAGLWAINSFALRVATLIRRSISIPATTKAAMSATMAEPRRRPVTRSTSKQRLVSPPRRRSQPSDKHDADTVATAPRRSGASTEREVTTPPFSSSTASGAPSLNRKTVVLALLVLQNASVSLLTRMSRTPSRPGASVYVPAVAVFTAELVKLSVSLTMLVRDRRQKAMAKLNVKVATAAAHTLILAALSDLFRHQRPEILKLSVPAALYALQNTLLYTALSNLDAATYQTTYQLKLLTTALFSLLFFRRSLSWRKWAALILLTIGVATVQLETTTKAQPMAQPKAYGGPGQNPRVGLLAILAACVSSGLAGGWFEYVLKSSVPASPPSVPSSPNKSGSPHENPVDPPRILQLRAGSPSLWVRNLQLSMPSLVFSFAGVLLSPQVGDLKNIWVGFTPLVWGVVLNQALGGLLVAMVVREADSVAKGFATSLAIVRKSMKTMLYCRTFPSRRLTLETAPFSVSTLAGAVFFGFIPGLQFLVGAMMVISSTILYAMDKSS
ncbi:BQ2448_1324 [Microbotryum intermedium]|uniref:BQ2448_1324 protein n=1 Tax=Microbotryum intermedium TaxID=269621 RepID=A0A238F7V3_9BASI|nr:BQ2448_1324 [Microbotryum intermedium]